jgi:PAS domain S-box-containing protein
MKRFRTIRPRIDEWGDPEAEREKLLYIIKALGGGIWEFDMASGAIACSRRWHEILGLDYDTQQVRSVDQFRRYIHPEDVERATRVDLEEVERLIARDERYAIDFRIIHQDGHPRWIRSVASLVRDAERGLVAFGCITDITPLMRAPAAHEDGAFAAPLRRKKALTVRKAVGSQANAITLSVHEVECLRWVSLGKTAKETAVIMGRSARTIEFHLNNAMRKLNAVNKVQAVFRAFELNLL